MRIKKVILRAQKKSWKALMQISLCENKTQVKDPNLQNEYCGRALRLLEHLLIESSVKKIALEKIASQQQNGSKDSNDDPNKPKNSSLASAAYMRFLCIKFEMTMAKKNVVRDNRPVQVNDYLYIGIVLYILIWDRFYWFCITQG